MAEDLYRIGAVAHQLDMTNAGLRKWCDEYADLLSQHATPEAGTARRFTQQDVDVLLQIAKLRGQGLNHDEIRLQLNQQAAEMPPETEPTQLTDDPDNAAIQPSTPVRHDPVQHWLTTNEVQPQQKTGATIAQLSLAFFAGVAVTFLLMLLAILFVVWLVP